MFVINSIAMLASGLRNSNNAILLLFCLFSMWYTLCIDLVHSILTRRVHISWNWHTSGFWHERVPCTEQATPTQPHHLFDSSCSFSSLGNVSSDLILTISHCFLDSWLLGLCSLLYDLPVATHHYPINYDKPVMNPVWQVIACTKRDIWM